MPLAPWRHPPTSALIAFALLSIALAGCSGKGGSTDTAQARATGTAACDNAALLRAQSARRTDLEVTFCGPVSAVRRERVTRSGRHKYFYVRVAPGDEIEVIANVDVMGEFPVHLGDQAQVRGRYFHDSDGRQGVDWTHHDTVGSRWPPGYVILNGVTYR
ncbi:MAG: DUF3465 domain-containing protein [bacterium]|nr:DUF3465 domain-containing protein [bacterium]